MEVKVNTQVLEKIFTVNLGVSKSERVLVFTDTGSTADEEEKKAAGLYEVAVAAAEVGKKYCKTIFLTHKSVGSHGKEPPVEAWRAAYGERVVEGMKSAGVLERVLTKTAFPDDLAKTEAIVMKFASDGVDAIIGLSKYSTSHTNFRKWLTKIVGTRYASMPMFEKEMLDGVMTADWEVVRERTERLVEMLSGGDRVHIKTPNGTDITFSIKGRKVHADTGVITKKGAFSNLPAGEAFLAPVEGTADGTLVLDWAPTRSLTSPIMLEVTGGKVVGVAGIEDYARQIMNVIEADPLNGNIAELGVGTNDRAERPDNILETEKILGSIHIAIGDNSTFGGNVRVPYHQDFIFFKPTMTVEKAGVTTVVLREGEPLF
jgi:leucyl aminopeptidase (aminopeptidase T)